MSFELLWDIDCRERRPRRSVGGVDKAERGLLVMISTIIFDAFDTLFKVEKGASAKSIIRNIVLDGNNVEEKLFSEEWKAFYKERTAATAEFMTERDIFISLIRMFYDRYNVDRNAEEDADSVLSAAFERKAFDEVAEVISELRKKYGVFIGSNTDNDVLAAVMAKNEISVDKVYTSENLGCYKPNPEFFIKILEENGLKAENVMFIGDSLSDDILGPKAVGIKTVLIDREGSGSHTEADYVIGNLRELVDILL